MRNPLACLFALLFFVIPSALFGPDFRSSLLWPTVAVLLAGILLAAFFI
jgi:hypothetical protein